MYCQKCGNKFPINAKFCNVCGFQVGAGENTSKEVFTGKLPALATKRLANYILDRVLGGIVFLLFWIAIWGLVSVLPINKENTVIQALNSLIPVLISMCFIINPLYYILFESIWQRTLGKWITKTKVVRFDGTKPSFLQILGRSFARWIPFEPFSFLFSNYPIGWHDRLSQTLVVPASYTEEDVKNINFEEAKKQKTSTLLTVIAIVGGLLVIIAIIGILASVVLASLNSARQKGADASIKANLSSARAQAELYYVDNLNSYEDVCTHPEGILSMKNSASDASGSDAICNDNKSNWVMSSFLKTNPDSSWCVDSFGNSREIIGAIAYNHTSCFFQTDNSNSELSLTGQEICSRDFANSTWDGKSMINSDTYECSCKSGYQWNTAGNACITPDKSCNAKFPNSRSIGNNTCDCKVGYTWNSTQTACITLDQSCNNQFPNSYSTGTDPVSGENNCDCKSGYTLNSTETACY